jgi:hypothetical protein
MPSCFARKGGTDSGRLHLQPPRMQQWFGVAAGLLQAFEHQLGSRFVGHGCVKVARHLFIKLVTRILLVHHSGHAFKRLGNLCFGHHAVVQPVGHVLAADAQRSAA